METIHVRNLEKYHPGYKDRELVWCKTYFKMLNADPEFELLCEIDKWRFIALIILELQIKKPVPNDPQYLRRKGFDIKKRSMSLTLRMLQNLVDIVTEDTNFLCLREENIKKRREEKRSKGKLKETEGTSAKTKYLDFVFLTNEEHQKLIERYGDNNTRKLIDALNRYIGSTGKKYKSHYYTILGFARRDNIPEIKKSEIDELAALEKRRQEIRKEYGQYYREKTTDELRAMLKDKNHITRHWLIKEIIG